MAYTSEITKILADQLAKFITLRRDHLAGQVGNLVIEVSDSTLRVDQTTKRALYALASIPFYWIINLVAKRLEVYAEPTGPDPRPDYRRRTDHTLEDVVPLILDGQEVGRIAVKDLLP